MFLRRLCCLAFLFTSLVSRAAEAPFVSLFDGQSLKGWKLVGGKGPGFLVKDGAIVCPADGGGNLFTEQVFENFVLRFEFKLSQNANSGLAIRAPLYGDAAHLGMEIQIYDEAGSSALTLKPEQGHGSIHDVVAAKRSGLKAAGAWNTQEVRVEGRWVEVTVNDRIVLAANLSTITDPDVLARHPGLLRSRGHIGLLGQGSRVEFRNLRLQELPSSFRENRPPYPGFVALYDGQSLAGWKGLLAEPHDNPVKRARLSPLELKAAQDKADARMRAHWKSVNGVLEYDGKGDSLCTLEDYGDFELFVDWKTGPCADSGIYLRGSPQVQIWDQSCASASGGIGSGGLFNNEKGPSKPLAIADKPPGEWNRFHIVMQGERVTVFLNDELVTWNVVLENYWDRNLPIFPRGQIELQNHGNPLWFKNIFLRELPAK